MIGDLGWQPLGIKGYQPTQPFNVVSVYLASSDEDTIHFPTLSELKAEMFDWYSGKEETLSADESLCTEFDIFATNITAEPVSPPITEPTAAPPAPVLPTLGDLTAKLLASDDKLFFISHMISGSSVSNLVQADLQVTLWEHPYTFQDGRFLVNLFTCHPNDNYFHAFNHQYWLEYHPMLEAPNP